MNYIVTVPPLVRKHLHTGHLILMSGDHVTTCLGDAGEQPVYIKGSTVEDALGSLETTLAAREPEQEAS